MEKPLNHHTVLSLLLIVVLLWGVNSVCIKYLTNFYPVMALAPIRLCLASGLLIPIVFRQYGFPRLSRAAWLPIAGIAVFCIFLHQIALTLGLKATSSTHAVLILGLNPLFTNIFTSCLLKETVTRQKGLGIFLGFSGLLFVVSGNAQDGATLVGDAITLVATLTFVIGSLFVKRATADTSPLVVTAYSHVLAAIGLLLLGLLVNPVWSYPGSLQPIPVAVLLFSSFFSTAVGALLWNMSIKQIGASTASLFQNGSPIVGVLASFLFLGEQLNWHHFAALTLVLLGVSLGTGIVQCPKLQKAS